MEIVSYWTVPMQTKSPLSGNHVAKQLKKFLRNHGVPYSLCNASVIITGYYFKPCVLTFQNDYVHVHVINEFQFSYDFPCNTLPVLIHKLHRFQVISEKELIRLAITKKQSK